MTSQSTGSGVPSGAAGGVLGGTYPSPQFSTNGTTPILGTVSSYLGSNTAIAGDGSYHDLVTLTLSAGTWLVWFNAAGFVGATSSIMTLRLWDGAAVDYGSTDQFITANQSASVELLCQIIAVSALTLHLSARQPAVSVTYTKGSPTTSTGSNTTGILALRIA